ncbi:hypothetical protein EGW08_004513 [Elysia chlorotica]|uniref:Uncharacterized protein n=1 Tax=Elysia chlorotica TaxID=188477 RepID=A0A3S1BGH1_ELYCH|nr:hypothetical protein EGW08_004513 [Elysia chlorotica]
MERMGAFEKSDYVPPRGYTRSAREKEKLANIMAYGEDQPRIPMKNIRVRLEPLSPLPDRFDELQKEIKDRQEFLKDMEAIGKGEQYRGIIATEISQKVREMELIDKKRSLELKHMIEEDEKKKGAETKKSAIPKPDVM